MPRIYSRWSRDRFKFTVSPQYLIPHDESLTYIAEKYNHRYVQFYIISWISRWEHNFGEIETSIYSVEDVEEFLKDGTWRVIKNEEAEDS